MYSICQFAKLINVTEQTLRNWDANGKLKPIKLESGHRRYTDEHLVKIKNIKKLDRLNIIYCRESTKQQKNSLENQIEKCKEFCLGNGLKIDKIISEFGSGLNYKRKGLSELISLIKNNQVENLIIFYKDRLVRFGFEIFEELAKQFDFRIIVIDNSETNKTKEIELADDIISIIHYFSMKIYGSRNYKKNVIDAEKNINKIKMEIL